MTREAVPEGGCSRLEGPAAQTGITPGDIELVCPPGVDTVTFCRLLWVVLTLLQRMPIR